MSNKKIIELQEITTPNPTDKLPIVNNGVTKAIQVQNLTSDTGWQDLLLITGFVNTSDNKKPQYRVINKVVYLRGILNIPENNPSNSTLSHIQVNPSFITTTSDGALYFKADSGSRNIPELASPSKSISIPNMILTRRYNAKDNSNQIYPMPIVATVSMSILTNGVIVLSGIQDVEDVPYGNDAPGTHPLRVLSTKIATGQPFPSYSGFNVGAVNNGNAIEIPPFGTVKAHEDIDTTQITNMGGFSIVLDGISYLSGVYEQPYIIWEGQINNA